MSCPQGGLDRRHASRVQCRSLVDLSYPNLTPLDMINDTAASVRNSASQTAGRGELNRGECKHQSEINQVQNGEISMETMGAGTAAVELLEGPCPWLPTTSEGPAHTGGDNLYGLDLPGGVWYSDVLGHLPVLRRLQSGIEPDIRLGKTGWRATASHRPSSVRRANSLNSLNWSGPRTDVDRTLARALWDVQYRRSTRTTEAKVTSRAATRMKARSLRASASASRNGLHHAKARAKIRFGKTNDLETVAFLTFPHRRAAYLSWRSRRSLRLACA